jgi:serine/threonine-protein kinase HipA
LKKLDVRWARNAEQSLAVGTLAEVDRRVYFEFTPAFIATQIELSPLKLRARPGLIEHTDRTFGPLPGVFDDSLPDGWGLLLMDRFFRKQGVDPRTLSPLDRLAYIGSSGMGALTYHPPANAEATEPLALDLESIGANARQLLEGEAVDVLPELERAGGSPGGARPKVLVGMKGMRFSRAREICPRGSSPGSSNFLRRATPPTPARSNTLTQHSPRKLE